MRKLITAAISLAAFVMLLVGVTAVSAQNTTKVPDGDELKVMGVITVRGADSFQMRTLDGSATYIVLIGPETSVKSNNQGVFRRGKAYPSSYLLRGLRVQVEGTGNAAGELAADSVRFNEADLRTAQSVDSRVDPVENEVKSNTDRIAATEENEKRMSGQIDEVASQASAAQATADAANKEAIKANNRINGLDQFELVKTIVVPFANGSYTLGPIGRRTIDEAAEWAKNENTKGWVIAVAGYADSRGNSAANKTLSERRANAVIGYLVAKHNLPIQRLVQPFGYGDLNPAATNATAAGRAANRRAEIRVLVNKGIADTQ